MKLLFIYANHLQLDSVPQYEQYTSSLTVPDEIQHLIGIEERILGIAEAIAQLTKCSLWLTCKPLGFDKYPIISRDHDDTLRHDWYALTIPFSFQGHIPRKSRKQQRVFQILGASPPKFPNSVFRRRGNNRKQRMRLSNNLFPVDYLKQFDVNFFETMQTVSRQLEILLNAQPESRWSVKGIHPNWYDYSVFDRYLKKQQQWQKAQEKKAKKSVVKGKGKVGKTRRFGAIPGVFQGVQFRSQLEIRLATELASRGIDWIYEKERLGEGNYLVDFYLPDHKIWIEVKGKFEARDHYLLKGDVVHVLESERNEQLFVYTSGKCFRVTAQDFVPLKRSDFWQILDDSKIDDPAS